MKSSVQPYVRKYKRAFWFSGLLAFLIPFAVLATFRTFYETKFPIFNVLAARLYNNFPVVQYLWWKLPFWAGIGEFGELIVSILYVAMVAGAVASFICFAIAYGMQQRYWRLEQQAKDEKLKDDIRSYL